MVPQGRGGSTQEEKDKYKDAKDAKHLLDIIGKDVHDKVHNEAIDYVSDLKGSLTSATLSGGETASSLNPCSSDYTTHFDANSNRHPCGNRTGKEEVNRFSKERGAECDDKKIEGNVRSKGKGGNNEGACAPYRRLSLCNKNFQKINNDDSTNAKHNLLLDVCMAANYEAQSLKTYRDQYDAEYPSSGSTFTMCTMLARSFADIGDIIRGKDLFRGYNEKDRAQKKKIQDNLKDIFKKIHDDVTSSGSNRQALKTRYERDHPDFFQLREDWWNANRETVWKAITCKADASSAYFRATCSDRQGPSVARNQCRCSDKSKPGKTSDTDQVPTYFDYVPQYLRWFEEWAEDFCRKKKHKLEDAKNKCRGTDSSGKERYCDLNGYDCEKTKRGRNKYRWDYKCTGCFLSCSHFRTWIDNQRKQFLKQRNKYDEEIKKYENGAPRSSRTRRNVRSNYDNGYEKKFYDKLNKSEYRSVDAFLGLLNKEKDCENIKDDKEGKIDFAKVSGSTTASGKNSGGDGNNKTFDHTEYCQACPLCGVEKKSNGGGGNTKWKRKEDLTDCPSINLYKPTSGAKGTTINFLYSGDRHDDIAKNLKAFCRTENRSDGSGVAGGSGAGGTGTTGSDSQDLYQKWTCYHVKQLEKDKNPEGEDDPEYEDEEKCGNKKCKGDCDCFQRWVRKKKDEWKNIKIHFGNQEAFSNQGDIGQGGFLDIAMKSPDFVLKTVLNKDLLLTSLQEAYRNEKDIEHIKQLLDEEKKREEEEAGVVLGGENNTTIDKLIEHEEGEAEKCLQKQEDCNRQSEREDTSGGRTGQPRSKEIEDDDEDEEDEDEVEEETEEKEEDTETTTEVTEQVEGPEEGSPPKEDTTSLDPDVCDTVKKALADMGSFTQACQQKYGGNNSRLGWKCIPSGDNTTTSSGNGDRSQRAKRAAPRESTTSSSGATCIPPRRRRLYVGKLEQWAEKYNKVANTQAEEKKPPATQDGAGLGVSLPEPSPPGEDPQTQLQQTGVIPPDFLRLMFYTLGDYRDILVRGGGDTNRGDKDVTSGSTNNNIVFEAGGTDEKDKQKMEAIQQEIDKILKQSGNNQSRGVPPNSGKDPGQTPESWWKEHAPSIWDGMVCALTYDTNSGGKTIEKVKTADNGNLFEKLKENNDYETVSFGASGTDARSGSSLNPETTKLKDFVERPTYFRYLEEWGEEFCRKQKHKLYIIKKECKVEENGRRGRGGKNIETPKCSCYGEHCDDQLSKNKYDTVADLECPGCGRHCRSYKKWIERKKEEFVKQKEAYGEQKKKYEEESKGGVNGFCGKLKDDAAQFLKTLASCSKNENDNGNGTIDFDVNGETFQHAKDCNPCSEFKIDCKKAKCTSADKKVTCNGNNGGTTTITASDIKNGCNSTHKLDMLVSDNNRKDFTNGLSDCANAGIFKGIRKDVWTCGNVCGYVVCKPENGNGQKVSEQEKNDVKHIITIRALLTHWVHKFLEDYKKIKHKISHCTKKGEEPKCIKECVEKWISTKKDEWTKIKNHYKKQNENGDKNLTSLVTNVLEELLSQIAAANDKGEHSSLQKLEKSLGCNCANHSHKSENSEKSDIIDCMLNKLENLKNIIKTCQNVPSGKPDTPCQKSPAPVEDEEEIPEENPVDPPKICPQLPKPQPEAEDEDACKAVDPNTVPDDNKDKKNEEDKVEESAKESTAAEEPSGPVGPPLTPIPQPPRDDPWEPLKNAMLSSTIMWTVGIGFATFTYFYLKKKTKASVRNLFQILQIPKSDYDIPTKLSPNRYIPYTSGKYRGKRYIYLEGDSGTDSGYTDHYSDITSSSESEYEELDINDIYAPRAPKYKTLIEVVLEPSGNNTTASGKNTPSDNTPTPQPITDDEWNKLKKDFISNMLQNTQNTEPNILHDNVDNNTHPTTSRHNMEEKPFIMSIHDRNLYIGEEYNYDMFNSGNNPINISDSTNSMDSLTSNNHGPYNDKNDLYSGIDLINDALSGNHIDIYDEMLKRKENELFGTKHHPKKHTTGTHNVEKNTNSDPIMNQLYLFHKWLDRHRNMCEKLKNDNERLAKLKEEWENETHSGNTHPSDSNKTLNTDVSIQIHMDNPKPINEFTNMDTILDDLDKYNEPYYDVQDDIYYDVNDHDASTVDSNNMDVPSKVKLEMSVKNTQMMEEKYPIGDVRDI
ncbi:hypothetical protein PFDG_01743 [Plasmodium falciparum Dd2]|uniref:Erythrocyte membrane protein 1 n=1 Tax=Plasmodium falciparum (isolate Dd2) TaxID=57267 RepID=A0A0L7M645_PLAF4|nr:hypothetical protein PFDG_01743 [Plasmodium falciparum Dd2]